MLPAISPAKFTDERQKRPQQVAEAIKSLIVERALMAGARLPGENELMRHFGMAKGTIREAISILEAQGLVATRTGPRGGTFVKEVAETRAKALLSNYFYFRNVTIADIYQLRRALEPELAATLAGKLSDAQLAQLEATVAEYSKPARDAEEEKKPAHRRAAISRPTGEFLRQRNAALYGAFHFIHFVGLDGVSSALLPAQPRFMGKGKDQSTAAN